MMFGVDPYVSINSLVCRHCGAVNGDVPVDKIRKDSQNYTFIVKCKWCNNTLVYKRKVDKEDP